MNTLSSYRIYRENTGGVANVATNSGVIRFRDYHYHKVVSCPVAGCTDSYMELQELAERKVVTMAAETLPYAHPCKGTVHIKAPPHPLSHPNQVVHNKNGLYCGITDQNGRCDIFVTSRNHQLHSPWHATAGDAIIFLPLPFNEQWHKRHCSIG